MEVPKDADPYQDYFKKKEQEKGDQVSKNEYQRLRNIARERKTKHVKGRHCVPTMSGDFSDLFLALILCSVALFQFHCHLQIQRTSTNIRFGGEGRRGGGLL